MIDFNDYAELRRRAEKRLTMLSIWPLMLFQLLAYLLVLMRGPYDISVVLLATMVSVIGTGISFFVYRRRTAANRDARRGAIDATLEDALDTGSPLPDPTTRELRLLALLLNEDLETRAGSSRVTVLSSAVAAALWSLTFWQASNFGLYPVHSTFALLPLFFVWLVAWGGFTFLHLRARRQSEERVRALLSRPAPNADKRKRAAPAPWWSDDGALEPDKYDEKPKRASLDHLLTDDGEWAESDSAYRHSG